MILLFIFLLIILMFYSYRGKWNPIQLDFYCSGEMLLIGHRGAPMLAQENTIESFTIAFAAGVKGIELDVQLSKDGLLVVFHDWNLENLTGSLIPIKDMDYSEIRDFSNKNNYKIPLLGEVLEICPKNMVINIEIKSLDYSNTLIVEKVVNMIETYKIKKTVVVSSFNPFVLKVAKKICPELPTAYLWSSEDVSFLINSPLWIWLCRPDGFHIDINNANEKNISWARKNNLAVLVFAVNNSFDLSKALELRVDGIFTDNPYLKLSSTLS